MILRLMNWKQRYLKIHRRNNSQNAAELESNNPDKVDVLIESQEDGSPQPHAIDRQGNQRGIW